MRRHGDREIPGVDSWTSSFNGASLVVIMYRVITILSGWRAFTLKKIFFWPKLKGSCVEMKKNTNRQPPTTLDFEPWQHGRCNQAPPKA